MRNIVVLLGVLLLSLSFNPETAIGQCKIDNIHGYLGSHDDRDHNRDNDDRHHHNDDRDHNRRRHHNDDDDRHHHNDDRDRDRHDNSH